MGITLTFTDLNEDEAKELVALYGDGDPVGNSQKVKAAKASKGAKKVPPVDDDDDLEDDDPDDDPANYTEESLNAVKGIANLRAIAKDEFDIDPKGLKKPELIEEILAAQDEESDDGDEDDDDLDGDEDDDLDDDEDDDEDDLDDEDDEPEPPKRSKKAAAKKAVAPRRARR